MQSLPQKILKSFTQIFTGQGISFVSGIFSGYFFALFLGPAVYGIWQTARIFLTYGRFVNLGIPFVMRRDFITLRAEGKHKEANHLAHVSMSYSFLVQPLFAIVFVLIGVFSSGALEFRFSLIIIGIMYITKLPAGIGEILHRGINDYKTIGITSSIYGVCVLCLIPVTYFFGFYGLVTSYLAINILISLYYFQKRPISYKFVWDFSVLKQMIITGFPLYLITLISTLFISVDKLLIAGLIDFENVGFYSLSTFLAQPMTLMLGSFTTIIFTQINEKYGRSKEPHVIEKQTYLPQKIFSYILPPFIGMGVVALPVLTSLLLPKYATGIMAAQINIFAILFLKLAGFSSSGLFILDKQKYTAISFFIAGSFKTLGSYWALRAGYGIESVALFSLLAYFFYNTMMLFHINRQLGNRPGVFLKRLKESMVAPLTILLFSFLYLRFHNDIYQTAGIINPWLQMTLGVLFMFVVGFTFLWKAYKMAQKFLKK